MTTKTGGTVPLKVTLVKEDGSWRVLSINAQLGLAAAAPKKTVPPDQDLRKLTTETLMEFDRAVKAKDFTAFHKTVSVPLQQQKTPAEMEQAFQVFVTRQIDLSPVQKLQPIFDDPPGLDNQELLVLKGYYPTPSRVRFQLAYTYEHPSWKLINIEIKVGDKVVPSGEELRKLAAATLLEFDRAVKAKDFTAFHKTVSTPLQQQKTSAQLKDAFQAFVDQQIDLSAIKEMQPIFDEPPGLNEQETLVLKGHYPSQPARVRFQLAYVYEQTSWKLISINVQVGE
jgi:hypothetical protein